MRRRRLEDFRPRGPLLSTHPFGLVVALALVAACSGNDDGGPANAAGASTASGSGTTGAGASGSSSTSGSGGSSAASGSGAATGSSGSSAATGGPSGASGSSAATGSGAGGLAGSSGAGSGGGGATIDAGGGGSSVVDAGADRSDGRSGSGGSGGSSGSGSDASASQCQELVAKCSLIDPGSGAVHTCVTTGMQGNAAACQTSYAGCKQTCGAALCTRIGTICHDKDEPCHEMGHTGVAGPCFERALECFALCM